MFVRRQNVQVANQNTVSQSTNWLAWENNVVFQQSQTQPVFGSSFVINFQEPRVIIHDCILQFNVSAIGGLTGSVSGYPFVIPSQLWIERYDIKINGVTIDSRYPLEGFAITNLFQRDEDRKIENVAGGDYASAAARNAKNNNGELFYVSLKGLFQQIHYELLEKQHEIQLQVFLKPVTSIVNQSTLEGTPTMTINSCIMIAKVSRLDDATYTQKHNALVQRPKMYPFHELKQFQQQFPSGSTTIQFPLSAITGKVAALMICVSKNTELTGDSTFALQKLSQWELYDSGSKNIMGGQPQTHLLSRIMMKYLSNSSYSTETGANFYVWSFSADIEKALRTGASLGTRHFYGNEQIRIVAESSANKTVFIFAFCENQIIQTLTTVDKR